jgi:hypothetical protein
VQARLAVGVQGEELDRVRAGGLKRAGDGWAATRSPHRGRGALVAHAGADLVVRPGDHVAEATSTPAGWTATFDGRTVVLSS